jgi:hypothetical protein
MARWRVKDENWYWPINVYTDEKGDQDPEVLSALGITVDMGTTLNLWRCRHCAAMVPGDGRKTHELFHLKVDIAFRDSKPDEVRNEDD